MKFPSNTLGLRLLAASALMSLQGCMVLPMAGAKLMQPAPQTLTVSGPKFPDELFRESAIKTGGVVTESSSQYARSEFRASSVRVELQQVKQGEYQLIGSSTGSWRMPSLNNPVNEKMTSIKEHLAAHGYAVVASETKQR